MGRRGGFEEPSSAWRVRRPLGTGGQLWGIAPHQIALLVVAAIGTTAVNALPTVLIAFAGQEAWLAALFALPIGLLPLALLYDLERRQPGLTLVEHARAALGPVAGGALGALPVIYLATVAPQALRQLAELIISEGLPRTPILVVLALLALPALYAVREGLEVVGRLAEVFVPFAALAIVVIAVTSVKSLSGENLLPLGAIGWRPLLQAAGPAAAFYTETVIFGFVLPFGGRSRRASWGGATAGLVLVGGLVAVATFWSLGVFGPLSGRLTSAIFQITRVASIAESISHLDALMVVVWVLGGFVKISLWIFVFSLAVAQWLGLDDYRPLTLPLAAFVTLGAASWLESSAAGTRWIMQAWPFLGVGLGIAAPLAIWLAVVGRDVWDRRLAGRRGNGGAAAPRSARGLPSAPGTGGVRGR